MQDSLLGDERYERERMERNGNATYVLHITKIYKDLHTATGK